MKQSHFHNNYTIYEKHLMENDSLVNIYKMNYTNQN